MSKDEIAYVATMFEQMQGSVKIILEAISDMQVQVRKVPRIDEELEKQKQTAALVLRAIKELTASQRDHEKRIIRLETA